MKANTKNRKGSSTAKKLVPAAGMLMISAAMLATSTYAWFTMSREVQVSGINMTATVPEDLQISLGALTAQSGGTAELVNSTGILTGGTASTPVVANDWSNAAIISSYYEMGKLIPASSTTGQNIYFTPDANGVGKTVSGEANYYQAAEGLTSYKANVANTAIGTGDGFTGDVAMATLHAATAENKTAAATAITTSWTSDDATTKYNPSTSWADTNDDGYYIDIPVWIRSSSDAAVTLKVDGYVTPIIPEEGGTYTKPISEADLELYKAARVAILHADTLTAPSPNPTGIVSCTAGNAVQANNIIPLNNPVTEVTKNETTGAVTGVTYAANRFGSTSILDSVNYVTRESKTADTLWGVSGLGTATATEADSSVTYTPANYTEYTAYDSAAASGANVVATIEGSGDNEYGTPKKLILRVWLDGEDGECWNQNAGQDFAITLKFSKVE